MKRLAENLFLLEGLRGANSYLLTAPDELALIDCGTRSDAGAIKDQIDRAGYSLGDLKHLILTHGHLDHAGGAAALTSQSSARVYAHSLEVPYLEGSRPLPHTAILKKLLFWLSDLLLPMPPLTVHHALQDGDRIEILGGLVAVHTPGHTPGSLSLFQPESGTVFCGDALFLAHPLTKNPGLRLPLPLVTVDPDLAFRSAQIILQLNPEQLLPGHGLPVTEKAGELIAVHLEKLS